MFGRRKAWDGVKADTEETKAKPLTLQERLNLLETGEVLLEYPAGLVQPFSRQELGRLKRRFVQMISAEDTSRELRLPLAAVLQMPELRAQPFTLLVARLILGRQPTDPTLKDIEDRDRELVSFGAFLTVLAVFSVKQTLELKRRERVDDGRCSRTVIAFPPPDDDESRMHLKQRDGLDFHFNDIFDPSVSQEQVFNEVCLDIVHSALDGYNGTILAYGQTGSGKTYTITGGDHYADRGIIPRVLSTIFEEFEKKPNMRYSCYISYLEIYNETVYDLLDRSHTDQPIEEWTKVLLMDDDEGDMHFRNLGVFEAVSEEEALNLLFLGNMNRVTSDTPMNQASSRSHSIFSVMIESRPADSDIIVTSKLHLVDLAGSERVYKRDGTQRMRSEGKHINLSLHHLEQARHSVTKFVAPFC
ncbi:hypothetical protein PHYPSEUDO_012030 [Phytophthora pseudosyringae]|uniref:Kinesin-like protein n=1 Tax=Phytophthora pseudosyringae TaxID=221518 RepID=A0A8T1V7D8_9STRA|nr:hypothetical protein PHYPSEUDO_012030 [Phytophthora pseudosyringae]